MADLKRLPISAFDPRFRTLLERGCRETVEVPCENARKAQHFRNVLNVYRARLKKEFPQERGQWEPLYGTIVSTKRDDPTIVTLRPRAQEFDSILGSIPLPGAAAPPVLDHDPLADLIKEGSE
jgi:hypothetical protein